MKLCDLTQFYSPVSGGVKRYVSEKVRYLREHAPGDEHILIIPGERDAVVREERSRVYTIRSPLLAESSGYRALLRLGAIEEILGRERPDLIESGDPYQVAWKAVHTGAELGIPVIGFYHSHFPEAYLRMAEKFLGRTATELLFDLSRRYIRRLYNRFERTLVPSPALGAVLTEWGVGNVTPTDLGVDTDTFRPSAQPSEIRAQHGIPAARTLLLYVGRLAQEKNTHTLFAAFRLLHEREPGRYHLLISGHGLQMKELRELETHLRSVTPPSDPLPITWFPYCEDNAALARYYRAADLFVHPGVQETFGLVALEAQASGTPVLGIRGSYMDRIIHCRQEFWAGENSPVALAEAIARHRREAMPVDPEKLHRRIADTYAWPQVFARLFDLYRRVIADYRRP